MNNFPFSHKLRSTFLSVSLNATCHLLGLLGSHHILHVSRIRVNFTARPVSFFYFRLSGQVNSSDRTVTLIRKPEHKLVQTSRCPQAAVRSSCFHCVQSCT